MSKNFTAKTSPKWLLWSIISAVLVLISIIVMAIPSVGVNTAKEARSSATLTVNVSMSQTFYDDAKDTIETMAETAITNAGLKAVDSYSAELSKQSHEIIYVFEKGTDLTAVEAALQKAYDESDAFEKLTRISVMSNNNEVLETIAGGAGKFVARSVLACVVAAVLALCYVGLRYKLWNGIVAFVSAIASGALTLAVVVLTRIPATAATVYAVAISVLVSLVLSVFFAAKNCKAEKANGVCDAEALSEVVPVCDATKLCGTIAATSVALAIIGACTAASFVWFALATLAGAVVAWFASVVLAPSVFLALRGVFAAWEAEKSRYDYKKGKKAKKAEKPAEEVESAE